jgi:hypothetical protein
MLQQRRLVTLSLVRLLVSEGKPTGALIRTSPARDATLLTTKQETPEAKDSQCRTAEEAEQESHLRRGAILGPGIEGYGAMVERGK